jgi:predicted kinase
VEQLKCWFLIGLPGSGKSTYIKNMGFNGVRVSTDDYIEMIAAKENKTYNEVWDNKTYKDAERWAKDALNHAIDNHRNIIYDQTNLTAKTRKKKLDAIPETYYKIGIVFKTLDLGDYFSRLKGRQGKTIPLHIIENMAISFEVPTTEEGFDQIYNIYI